jgi:hypothetical protein
LTQLSEIPSWVASEASRGLLSALNFIGGGPLFLTRIDRFSNNRYAILKLLHIYFPMGYMEPLKSRVPVDSSFRFYEAVIFR